MADIDKRAEKEEEDGTQQKKSKKPVIIITVVVGTLLIVCIAFIIVFKFLMASPKDPEAENSTKKEAYFGELFAFEEPIIVNLAETRGQRYLKVNVQFEVSDEKVREELTSRKAPMLDLMISILSSKTIEDVANTVGRNRLRREIIDKANAELVSGKVINVYFTEFVIQ